MKKMCVVGIVLVWAWMVAGLGMGAAQTAAAKRPMTFADLMAMKRVSDPQVSPSGKWVLFSVTDVSLEKNTKVNHLWVVPLNPTRDDKTVTNGAPSERQITFGDGESFGRFSPDGKWVSMTMKEQIYQAPWDEGTGRLGAWGKMTNVAGGADGAIWSPDSKRLMFTADVYPECSVKGGEKTNTGVLRSAQDDGIKAAEPATWAEENACDKAKDDAAAASPVKGQVWDALLYRHWDQYTGQKRSHILVVDFVGNVRDLTPASVVGDAETPTWMLGGPQEYAWAPDSKEIAYVTNLDPVPAASTNNDVFTLRLDEPGAKAEKVSTSPGSDDEPAYSPDGRWLAFRSQARAGFESDRFRLMVVQRVSESAGQQVSGREWSEPKELMPKFDNWVDEFIWSDDSRWIYFTAGDRGQEVIYGANVISDNLYRFGRTAGEWSSLTQVPGKDELVAALMRVDKPTEIALADLIALNESIRTVHVVSEGPSYDVTPKSLPAQFLTHIDDDILSQLDLPKMESFWFAGAEGTKVQGFILRPPGFDPAKKYPVKFVMHGGPQTAWGDSWSYRWNWELLAADGYVVVGINRRGSTGYGQKFVDEVSGDWGGRAYEDLMKGLDYAEATYSFLD